MVNEAQNPATSGIPKTEREFLEWMADTSLTPPLLAQAYLVKLSHRTLYLNKNNPTALAKAQAMHDADMAKLEAMFGPPLSE